MRGTAGTLVVLAALSGCTVVKEQKAAQRLQSMRPPGPATQTAWKQHNTAVAQTSAGAAAMAPAGPAAVTVVTPQSPWPFVTVQNAIPAQPGGMADQAGGTLVSATFVETPREPVIANVRSTAAMDTKVSAPASVATGGVTAAAVELARGASGADANVSPPPAPGPLLMVGQSSNVLPPPEPPVFPAIQGVRPASAIVTPTPAAPSAPSVRMVNGKRIHLNFELKDVGESGISGIELWYTQDTRSWKKYDGQPQTKAPYVVEVNGEGLYGFTMVARSGVGFSRDVPQPGELPQVWVEVDLTKPAVRVSGVELHCNPKTQNLVIRWSASDKNLTARPITLSYAEIPEGPWTPIAANLENSGRFEWAVPASVPKRIFVRVEATDLVGHLSSAHTASSVLIDRARPTVSILTVEPDKKN